MLARLQKRWIAFAPNLRNAILFSQAIALLWWAVAFYLHGLHTAPIWIDQESHIVNVASSLANPYALPGFVYPPWTTIPLLPFALIPLPIATLIQICLLFGLITAVMYKFEGSFKNVLIVLLSYMALDAAFEINIDWLVALGLLLPAAWSGPFLLIKPQDALGVILSFRRRDILRTGILSLLVILVSLLLWPGWPQTMWHEIQIHSLGQAFNLAPLVVFPWPIALGIGLLLAFLAFRRRDPVLSILAWVFFVPYITYYSLLLPFAMMALKIPRITLIISLVMWVAYGRYALLALTVR